MVLGMFSKYENFTVDAHNDGQINEIQLEKYSYHDTLIQLLLGNISHLLI
jgi:hypothetical protein